MTIQNEFKPAINEALILCKHHFTSRPAAIYLSGSIHVGEAWPGESDADCFIFLHEEPNEGDLIWKKENEKILDTKYPIIKGFHLNIRSTDFLKAEDSLWKFILRYNSLCLIGNEYLDNIEKEGALIHIPSPELAKNRLGWLKGTVKGLEKKQLLDAQFGELIAPRLSKFLPTDFLASRKLIRYFLLVEGAYLLMLTEDFSSFRVDEVFPKIAEIYPQWKELIEMSELILKDPFKARISPLTVREKLLPFDEWLIEKVKSG